MTSPTAADPAATSNSARMRTAPAGGSREAVARLLLERGPQTALALAEELGMTPAGVRRHLDALLADGLLAETVNRRPVQRGRGRPARLYALTDAGRSAFPHAYDDLATTALRYLRMSGGDAAVQAFAEHRATTLQALLAPTVGASQPADQRAGQLAAALTSQGYAATTEPAGTEPAAGVQVCQHHCPVAHVASEFPELCEAETRAFERVLGTYVQRLATIGHGDGVCTTYVPVPPDRTRTAVARAATATAPPPIRARPADARPDPSTTDRFDRPGKPEGAA